jgi:hypothetical protein
VAAAGRRAGFEWIDVGLIHAAHLEPHWNIERAS